MKCAYFKNSWNCFDFSVLGITYIGILLEQLNIFSNIGTTTSIIRVFRIMRILRLIKRAKTLRILFQTFIYALPSLANIAALLGLLLFIFSILGMEFFSFEMWSPIGLNSNMNFMSFASSFFTLYASATA